MNDSETQTSQTPDELQLPESLSQQLAAFEKRLCLMETIVAVFGAACGLLLTYAMLFASDRVWNTPAWLRGMLTLAGGLALGLFAYWWLHHWWWRRRNTRQLAGLVQKQYGRLGDRLLGVVELVNARDSGTDRSPALCRAAIRQVADEAGKLDFIKAVPTRRPKRLSITFLVTCAIIASAVLLSPQAGLNALMRWVKPLSSVQRYTFVSLSEMPGEHIVAHGEPFEIVCGISSHSRWRPANATCRIDGQPRIDVKSVGSQVVFRIPGQTKTEILSLRIGDAVKKMTIIPVFRPELLALRTEVVLPAYLQIPPRTNEVTNGHCEFLEGSRVRFEGTVSRTLSAAILNAGNDTALGTDGSVFSSDVMAVADLSTCRFSWIDHHGLAGSAPYALDVVTVLDAAPIVDCQGLSRTIAILQNEVVDLEVHAEDDYGVQQLWVNWKSVDSEKQGAVDVRGTKVVAEGSPYTRTIGDTFSFSPIEMQVPDETMITLCAYTSDYFPGRKPAMSLVYHIYVLSEAQHAKLIQQQMESIQSRIEDLARDEEHLLEQNRKLAELSPEEIKNDKTTAELKENELTERRNASRLQQLQSESEDLLKEALRNKGISAETLKRWAELTAAMAELATGEMTQSSQSLQQAASSKQHRPKKLDEAIAMEKKILEKLREMERKLNASIQDMIAKSFVNRLLAAAATEKEIEERLTDIVPRTIGMSTNDIPADVMARIQLLATRQKNTRQEVGYVQDDIAGFYNRTRIEVYGTLHDQMKTVNVTGRLGALADSISQNHSVSAMTELQFWQEQLQAWAEMLKKKGGGGGSGSGECKGLSESDIEVLIALMRARSREEALRENTRLLDREKDATRDYAAKAKKLSAIQDEIEWDTRQLGQKVMNRKLQQLIDEVSGEMVNASMFLRRPQTDAQTIAIETAIIELLSNSMSDCSGSCSAMGQSLMMSMGMGAAGSGSNAGGMTDRRNTEMHSSVEGDPLDARRTERASGAISTGIPVEFKNVLEAYFEALEKSP